MKTTTDARVYVGTYAKYNDGNLKGEWLNLEDYRDKDEFMEAARALHADEVDPELMFQDFSGFPKDFYAESTIDEQVWAWLTLDDDTKEMIVVYMTEMGMDFDIDAAQEAYAGQFTSEADWAEEFLNETGALESVPENLRNYIDFESYARDARLGGDMCFCHFEGSVWAFYNR